MRMPPLSSTLAAFALKRITPISRSRALYSSSRRMPFQSKAATEAEGTIIVGGGISGLAMATALRNVAGISNIKVLEASVLSDFTNERAGAAAQLGPNGLRALRFISSSREDEKNDVIRQVYDMGGVLEGNVMMMPGGQSMVLPDTTRGDTGMSQVLLRWGKLRSLLMDQIPRDCIVTDCGSDIAGYETNSQNNVDSQTHVRLIDSSGKPIDNNLPSTPLIIGTDGVRSVFRAMVRKSTTKLSQPKEDAGEDVKYGGRINIKAVVNKSLNGEYKSGHTYASFAPDGSVAVFAGPAGDEMTYWAISVADSVNTKEDDATSTTTFIDDLPTGANGRVTKESIKDELLTKLHTLDSDAYVSSVIDLIESTPVDDVYYQKSEEATELGTHPLHSKDGHVVLAGDAAHAFSASYGQAANFALEDAATLAACIRDGDNLQNALEEY
eukprot:scaffold145260_cov28-Cyclotella_meneghiniana.AAC.1